MNNQSSEDSQQNVDISSGDLSVSDFDDLATAGRQVAIPQHESVLADIDAIQIGLAITMDTPSDVKQAALSPDELSELDAVLADFELHDQKAELRDLRHKTVEKLKSEARRNGFKATAHKKQMRQDYAAHVLDTEGREVRSYLPATTERRQDQNKAAQKKRRDNMTDDQKKAQSAARSERRRRQKAEKTEAAQRAVDARTIA